MTTIRWTDQTWNFFVGCFTKSAGCTNCYAARMSWRLSNMGVEHYHGVTDPKTRQFTGRVHLAPHHIIEAPLRRRKPAMFFVNSMSDWLHEAVQDEWLEAAFSICEQCPHHIF